MRRTPFANICLLVAFLFNSVITAPVSAQELVLPKPGVMLRLSSPLSPAMLKGMKVDTRDPFKFEFVLDQGDERSTDLKDESTRLIKYFLASLTIPERDLWVNLSPYEKDRVIPESFGTTEMGRDLLAQDYILKQVTASLIYPEDEIGRKFWKRVYEKAAEQYKTTNIPVNTFNKVWIVPEKAVVYENAKSGTAYVVESRLKVMLEEDYLSREKNMDKGVAEPGASPAARSKARTDGETRGQDPRLGTLGSEIVREIVIPELTREVNEGKNFAQLRQVYNSLILATWYKKKIKDSILSKVYADKNKIASLSPEPSSLNPDAIYKNYLQAFKKGVYNYIKEDVDPVTQERIPRKYFSGGFTAGKIYMDRAMTVTDDSAVLFGLGSNVNDRSIIIEASFKTTDEALGLEKKLGADASMSAGDRKAGQTQFIGYFPSFGAKGHYQGLGSALYDIGGPRVQEVYNRAAVALGYLKGGEPDPSRLFLLPENIPQDRHEKNGFIGAAFLVHNEALHVYMKEQVSKNKMDLAPKAYTGESLGIVNAAIAVGALSLEDAVKLAYFLTKIKSEEAARAEVKDNYVIAFKGPQLKEMIAALEARYGDDFEVHKYYAEGPEAQANAYVAVDIEPDLKAFVARQYPSMVLKENKSAGRHASHSKKLAGAKESIEAFIRSSGIRFGDPALPIIPNTNRDMITSKDALYEAVLEILSQPMYTSRTVAMAEQLGADVLIEMGLGATGPAVFKANHAKLTAVEFTGREDGAELKGMLREIYAEEVVETQDELAIESATVMIEDAEIEEAAEQVEEIELEELADIFDRHFAFDVPGMTKERYVSLLKHPDNQWSKADQDGYRYLITSQGRGQKLIEISPLGSRRYFGFQGRWLLEVDVFGNPTVQCQWSKDANNLELIYYLSLSGDVMTLKETERPNSRLGYRNITVFHGQQPLYRYVSKQGMDFVVNGEIPPGTNMKRDGVFPAGYGLMLLNIMAKMARDRSESKLNFAGPRKDVKQDFFFILRDVLINDDGELAEWEDFLKALEKDFRPKPLDLVRHPNLQSAGGSAGLAKQRSKEVLLAVDPATKKLFRVFYQGKQYILKERIRPVGSSDSYVEEVNEGDLRGWGIYEEKQRIAVIDILGNRIDRVLVDDAMSAEEELKSTLSMLKHELNNVFGAAQSYEYFLKEALGYSSKERANALWQGVDDAWLALKDLQKALPKEKAVLSAQDLKGYFKAVADKISYLKARWQRIQPLYEAMDPARLKFQDADLLEIFNGILDKIDRILQLTAAFEYKDASLSQLMISRQDADLRIMLEVTAKSIAETSNAYVDLTQVPEHMMVKADPFYLSLVLLNIVKNAAFALKEKGAQGRIIIEAQRSDESISIRIADNGKGIRDEDIGKIFDEGFTTKGDEGSGLGLAFSRKVIEAHGGRIEVERGRKEGAVFMISIPVDSAMAVGSLKQMSREFTPYGNDVLSNASSDRAMSSKDILDAYLKGRLQEQEDISAFLLSRGVDPKELDIAIEEIAKTVIRRELKDPKHPLNRLARGSESMVYKGIIDGNDIIVKDVQNENAWKRYVDYQERLGPDETGRPLVAGYMVIEDLEINVDGKTMIIPHAVVQEEGVQILDRIRQIRKEYASNPSVQHELIDNILNDYFDMYIQLMSRGLIMKPNGFLVDVGIKKGDNQVVVLDVGDLLNQQEAESTGMDMRRFDEKFITSMLLVGVYADFTITNDGKPRGQLVEPEEELVTGPEGFNYGIVQRAKKVFADGGAIRLLSQKAVPNREAYSGTFNIRQKIEKARLALIEERIKQNPPMGELPLFDQASKKDETDKAMLEKGGIDLNADKMDLQIKNAGESIDFKITPQMLRVFERAQGFVPVIINMRPLGDIRVFLGANEPLSVVS